MLIGTAVAARQALALASDCCVVAMTAKKLLDISKYSQGICPTSFDHAGVGVCHWAALRICVEQGMMRLLGDIWLYLNGKLLHSSA
jgi:hypothetical protein